MPRFFKRKVAIANQQNDNDNAERCAIVDTYRIRSCDQPLDFTNQNRLIENESNAERLTGSTSSVGERVSNFVNGIIGKMGKNRRKNKISQQPIQQQQQQSHLKKVHLQGEKQQPQHGKIQRQPSIKKGQHNEFYSNETVTENNNNKSAPVSFDGVNIKKSELSTVNDEKVHRNLHDSNKNNIKNHHNTKFLHTVGGTFNNTNELDTDRVVCINRIELPFKNATVVNEHQAKVRKQQNDGTAVGIANATVDNTTVPNQIDRKPNDRVNKNSLFGAETTTLHPCIEIDFSINNGETNSDHNECKRTTVENNNHISSSAPDSNNNEVNIVVEKSNDVRCDVVVVNCKSDDPNAIHSSAIGVVSQPLENSHKFSCDNIVHTTTELNKSSNQLSKRSQLPVCKNGVRTMGQLQSTNTPSTTSKPNNNTNSTKYANETSESKASDPKPNSWHDAAQAPATATAATATAATATAAAAAAAAAAAPVTAQAPHYDKNKINFSNEINEILETKTSPKQSYREPGPGAENKTHSDAFSEVTANEIKDVFYETSSELNVDEIKSPVFASNRESVTTPQYVGTEVENVNDSNNVARSSFETASNGTINHHKTDTGIPLKNVQIDVTPTANCDSVKATTKTTTTTTTAAESASKTASNVPSSSESVSKERCVKNDQNKNNFIGANKKIEPNAQLNQNGEQSEQMEQNVIYRVDSYNSDEALELSDIEETVIDQNGKVIEVKTVFKQRPSVKTPVHDVQFTKSANSVIDGTRQIIGRRRSNSISGSHGIEIVEVGATTTNHDDYLTQQPFVSFVDESNAIKLSDLRDNTKGIETEVDHAIDIIEIVEESESGSEYEEIEEEIEEEVTEEEIDEEDVEDVEDDDDDDDVELISADDSLSNESATVDKFTNGNTQNAFKSNANGSNVGDDGKNNVNSMHSTNLNAKVQQTKPNHPNIDNDVIRVLVNGQPTQFSANTPINLSTRKNTETLSHSLNRVNENELNKSPFIDKLSKGAASDKISSGYSSSSNNNNNSISGSSNAYDNKKSSNESMQQQQQHQQRQQHPPKYSDDAMHLPDIVVGSTLLVSNGNNGAKKPIPLSRSPPKIVVNDQTLDSWTSTEGETGTLSDSFDESIELDGEEAPDLSDDEEAEKKSKEKLFHSNILNVGNKNEPNECQNNIHNEAKQHELNLLAQINEANSNVAECQLKISELTYKISELERDLTVKSWNVERLQGELEAAYKEHNCVKTKLKLLDAEMDALRLRYSEKEDDHNIRYNNLDADHIELKQKLDQMQSLAITLQVQLSKAQSDLSDLRGEKEKLVNERNVERQALQDALDAAIIERAENDAKWQRDFEQLRTFNSDREELLLQDCEWKIRAIEKSCKDRLNAAEQAKQEAIKRSEKITAETQAQLEKVKHLKQCEAELAALRGLTNEQRQSIAYLTQQLEEMKTKLDDTSTELEEATAKIQKMALKFSNELSDKDREMIAKIDEVRGEVAAMWEDRLLTEMLRLKVELETCFAEDRMEAVHIAQKEHLDDVAQIKENFAFREKMLQDEIQAIRDKLADRNRRLDEANEKADKQIMQIRLILNKSEQGHQREMQTQEYQHQAEIDRLTSEFEEKEAKLKNDFETKLQEMKRKSAEDLNSCKTEMIAKLKREYETRYEKFKADKEEEQLDMQRNYKRKLSDADDKIRDYEILHQREVKDLKAAHSMDRSSLEQRDLQNSQEIETLHRKCRCLTKLFEEMRIRYERREPRAEDIREIQELKMVIEAQDKDLRLLTEKLREMQMQQNFENGSCDDLSFEEPEMVMQPMQMQQPSTVRKMKKPSLNCDVIYEAENEEE